MKQALYLFSALLFASCATSSKTITITNNSSFDRNREIVEVKLADVALKNNASFVLYNQNKEEVPYQIINNETLIFQSGAMANSTASITLKAGTPSPVQAMVSARQVPERKDDFAWENDLAAYRMYGPALANENPSNGVDLWLKRTNALIVDKFYHDELVNKKSYHVDHGLGLDCYKVGPELGAGGIAPFVDGKVLIGKYYDSYQVITNGHLRAEFVLIYNNFVTGNGTQKKTITIRTEAGGLLNKAVVRYQGEQTIPLAAGISLHDGKGKLQQSERFIAYAEDAISSANIPSGRNYVGVLFPLSNNQFANDEKHALIKNMYMPNTNFVYYFGGGWSKWGFDKDEDWFNAMRNFDTALNNPLKITVK